MSALGPQQRNGRSPSDLSEDEGCRLVAGNTDRVSNSKVSAMYLRQHGDEIHEALDVRTNITTYSEELGQNVLICTPNVRAALEWYTDNNEVPFNVFDCSWDDLFQQIARAKGDYEIRGSKKSNLFRYLWRKAGTHKAAITPWLQLLPEDHGLSIVRGAIGLVFHLAEQSHLKDQKVLDAFDDITETIHNAMSKGVSFYRDQRMTACRQALCDCLVQGVADLVWSLKPEGHGENLIQRFKSKQERRKSIDLDGLMKRIRAKSLELDRCADEIAAQKADETHRGVGVLKKEALVARAMLVDVHVNQGQLLNASTHTTHQVDQVRQDVKLLGTAAYEYAQAQDGAVKQLLAQNQEIREAMHQTMLFMSQDRAQVLSARDSQNGTIRMLTEMVIDLKRTQYLLEQNQSHLDREIRRSLTPMADNPPLTMSPFAFVEAMDVPLMLANDDLRMAMSRSSAFNARSHRQAQSLLATDEFRAWLNSNASELLYVDGNDSTNARSTITPMSLLCASLCAALENARGDSVIVFPVFCGLHSSANDPVGGPSGMLRTLLVQLVAALVRQHHYSRDERDERDRASGHDLVLNLGNADDELLDDLHEHHIPALTYALRRLLEQAPPGVTVICLVDGVCSLEMGVDRDVLADVVSDLYRLVDNDRNYHGTLIKVLLTSAYRSTFLVPQGIIDPRDHVVLLGGGGRGGHGLLSEASVTMYI